ncbi:MAG: crossover junction endodeoxyribonuclease RuvC [Ruminococcaceae bacterium]|nr:crossover junction endodeoxyribonuclease RuvC [Oscillospiraceae bacterium]
MIIFGVDPGFALTGYGIIEADKSKLRLLEAGCVSTKADELFTARCEKIYNELSALMQKYKPDAFAVEELFFNSNQKTAIMVAQGRGVAVLAATHNKIPVYEYTPLQVKQSVAGYGRADKNQVQQMVKVILKLDKIIKPDDAADAVAIAISHAYGYRGAKII